MKKNFKVYLISWVVALALFNVIAFVVPSIPTLEKYTSSFWIGYVFITIALIGQLVCSYMALKDDAAKKLFYNISLVRISYIGLIVSFIIGGLCMLLSRLPYWVAVILCAIVLTVNVIAVLKAAVAINEVERIDQKIETQTAFTKSLIADAESLVARAKSETIKAECKKVYEVIRYSDPMSHAELATIESEITHQFGLLVDAVKADDTEKALDIANEICLLINDRNKKCKLLK